MSVEIPSVLVGLVLAALAVAVWSVFLWVLVNLAFSHRRSGRHPLCRMGFHAMGWSGAGGPGGKQYRCERGHGCDLERWGR